MSQKFSQKDANSTQKGMQQDTAATICTSRESSTNENNLDSAISPKSQVFRTQNKNQKSRNIRAQIDMWTVEHEERDKAIERHLGWIRNHEGRSGKERSMWIPSNSGRNQQSVALKAQDVQWGVSMVQTPTENNDKAPLNPWDEDGSLAFGYAQCIQDDYKKARPKKKDSKEPLNNLTHLELDVEGLDAKGKRLRAQRILEVNLNIKSDHYGFPRPERATMEMKRTLILKEPEFYSFPPIQPRQNEPCLGVLAQLAQHELDQAVDERNHFLREVFAQDVDHVRKRRESTIGDHEWLFHKPEVSIRGPDGTVLRLSESRSDATVDGTVTLCHTITIIQIRSDGRSHLFDMPIAGSEAERQIREARWRISSAVDRCIATGAAERFVMDLWVDGTILPRN